MNIPAGGNYPHDIEVVMHPTERRTVAGLIVGGKDVPLTRWASDALLIAAYNLDEIEQRRVYWRADIRRTAERLMAGEMEDEEPNA